MSAHTSSSSAPPPLPPPTHPLTNPHSHSRAPTSISPTLPSSSSSTSSPNQNSHTIPSLSSLPLHSPETARQIAEARTALEASMSNIGSSLDSTLRSRAQDLHSNSKQLEKQQKDVVKATEALRKEGDKLKKLADEGMRRVKELGNVQNWAEMLERDFLVLGETLRLANGGSGSDGSGSYTGSESEWETGSEGSRGEHGGSRELPAMLDGGGEARKMDVDVEQAAGIPLPIEKLDQQAVNADGDTQMDGTAGGVQDKWKGKAVEVLEYTTTMDGAAPTAGGSSTATTTTGSTSDPSSSSVHTAASVAS